MIEALKVLENLIVNDVQLKGIVSTYEGRMSYFNQIAPSGVESPFITAKADSISLSDNEVCRLMTFALEIYDVDKSPATVFSIARRIQYIMKNISKLLTNYSPILDIKIHTEGQVPSSVQEEQHYHLDFWVKYTDKNTFI